MESMDSRPASLRCPESRNTDDKIQVSFSHAELALNLNERFTQYRERTRSLIQHSQDSDVVGNDQNSGMVTTNWRPKFRKCRAGETLQELAAEIERLARRAFPIVSADIRDHLTRDAFVDALDPSDLSLRVRVQEPKTLQDDLTSAIKLEVVLNQMERPKTPSKNPLP